MKTKSNQSQPRVARRRFLGLVASGAAAAGAGTVLHGEAPGRVHAEAISPTSPPPGKFGRMFQLAPAFEPNPAIREALMDIGKLGGIMDAKDDLTRGPVLLLTDPALSVNNPDNPTHTAGTTFMGQFFDHDITFDVGSDLGGITKPEVATNGRTPAFDLDSVYGAGPFASPMLYDPRDNVKLKVESGGLFEDLPRTADNRAIIGDPRNDENLMIAGLQAAFLLFHNRAVDVVRALGATDHVQVFNLARQLTTWHYQWMIIHEFLPLFVGQGMVNDVLSKGRQFFLPTTHAFIPVEFQSAAYRFGHSIVRPSYRANLAGDNGQPFFGFIFNPEGEGSSDPADLRGGARAPRRFIDWQTFFDFGDGQLKRNKKIDTKISSPLFNIPAPTIPGPPFWPLALPQRTFLRHLTWELPSGQDIARAMGAPVIGAADLDELAVYGLGLETNTPLWYYVLKEAELMADGEHLGPVGGRIVAEVFIGLLQLDSASYVSATPGWRPTLPAPHSPGGFRMVDFLTFAGVDPKSRAHTASAG